jgi:membrane fusion protein (multidrug efflux system)
MVAKTFRASQLALLSCLALSAALAGTPALAQQAQGQTPAVLVQAAELKAFADQAEYIAKIQALEKVDLRARVQGFIGPRQFEEGGKVKAGQLLFLLEQDPFKATLDEKKAALAAAEATRDNAKVQLDRTRDLALRNTASQAQLDQRIAEDARARADVLQAEAQVRDAEIQLSYTEIKAPIDGRIGRAIITQGNYVGPNSGTLATLVRDDQVQVLFPITQRELLHARRKPGAEIKVRVRLADDSFAPETGKVDFVDVQADSKTDTQTIRAIFTNTHGLLTDGQSVRVNLEQAEPEKVVTIPQAALAVDQAGPYVLVVGQNNVVERRRIKLGQQRDGIAVVTEGVSAGDLVIVQGQQRVRPGMTVEARPAGKAS